MVLPGLLLPLLTLLQSSALDASGEKVAIKDEVQGKGPVVHLGDVVSVEYTGTLRDGTVFESNSGQPPMMFYVGEGVMKGWDIGLQGMHEGGKRDLTIPPALGFGTKAKGPVPANSSLYFTVSVIKIEPKVEKTVLAKGTGPAAKAADVAYVYLKGGVRGGKEIFDSRLDEKDPVGIVIGNRSLPIGFVPALIGMQVGEKRKVVIPPSLAYGSKGVPPADQGNVKAGSAIPPNSTMEFTIELVKLDPAKPQDP